MPSLPCGEQPVSPGDVTAPGFRDNLGLPEAALLSARGGPLPGPLPGGGTGPIRVLNVSHLQRPLAVEMPSQDRGEHGPVGVGVTL